MTLVRRPATVRSVPAAVAAGCVWLCHPRLWQSSRMYNSTGQKFEATEATHFDRPVLASAARSPTATAEGGCATLNGM